MNLIPIAILAALWLSPLAWVWWEARHAPLDEDAR